MAVYRETDGNITREYSLEEDGKLFRKQTQRALVEIMPTKEYGVSLFIDNELQFAVKDEKTYHELLVHPCLSNCNNIHSILILGGGDGCAAREVLKWLEDPYRKLASITLFDWDEELVNLFQTEYESINEGSLTHPIVQIENQDIMEYNEEDNPRYMYDCIIVDLLDPDFTKELGQYLWEKVFMLIRNSLDKYGSVVINAGGITSSNVDTVNDLTRLIETMFSSMHIHLYKVFVPSFGREWCFVLLNHKPRCELGLVPGPLMYLNEKTWKAAYTYGWSNEILQQLHLNISHQFEEENDGSNISS